MTTSIAPVESSTNKTFVHVSPPFVVLYKPLSGVAAYKSPIQAAKTISGFVGCTAKCPVIRVFCKPTFAQVLPASVDL